MATKLARNPIRGLIGAFGAAVLALALSSCSAVYVTPVVPYNGSFTDFSAPLDVTFDRTQIGSLQGRASTVSILSLFAYGDASVEAAARQGNVGVVTMIDHELLNILGIYTKYTTVVSGR
jgi:hypothetical protein